MFYLNNAKNNQKMQKKRHKKAAYQKSIRRFSGGDDQRPAALRMSLGRLQLLLR